MAATFNTELFNRIGQQTAVEARIAGIRLSGSAGVTLAGNIGTTTWTIAKDRQAGSGSSGVLVEGE